MEESARRAEEARLAREYPEKPERDSTLWVSSTEVRLAKTIAYVTDSTWEEVLSAALVAGLVAMVRQADAPYDYSVHSLLARVIALAY